MSQRFSSPNQQQFMSSAGVPIAGGHLYFYASGTDTPLNTYSNSTLTSANLNPVVLDSAGRAGSIFLQNLAYKVVLTDANDVQVWTEDPVWSSDYSAYANIQPVSGSPNGQLAGTASTTGGLPGSSMAWDYVNNILYVCTTTGTITTAVWTAVNAATASAYVPPPGGRLTPTSGTPVINSDVVAATSFVYTPYIGNSVPIYNGTVFTAQTFTELTMTLSASQALNTIYDVFIFSNSGVLTLVTGPAWATSTAGSGARGSGASTTQITSLGGIWVNAVQISGRNASTTYTIAANLATYLGSIQIDGTAGQVSCYIAWGQNRKFGIWNAYNRVPITLSMGDNTGGWVYNTATVRQSNGSTGNTATIFTGLPEERAEIRAIQALSQTVSSTGGTMGIGINSTTAYSGKRGVSTGATLTFSPVSDMVAYYTQPAFLGAMAVNFLESGIGTGTATFQGGNANMALSASYRA